MKHHPPEAPKRIGSRNAAYQELDALLRNRTKRHRRGAFVVQGVRSIRQAVARPDQWQIEALIRGGERRLSNWANDLWAGSALSPRQRGGCDHIVLAPELFAHLADKTGDPPELLALVAIPPDDLGRMPTVGAPLIVAFDRPSQPGNIGSLMRSMDAFGANGLIVGGHAADPYDPKSVRASTGSLFSLPTVRVESHHQVMEWVRRVRSAGTDLTVLGTDEGGEQDLRRIDLAGPLLLVIGNETRGLARAWREACDGIISIPMVGSASSLNAATSGAIVLHEALRQRMDVQAGQGS